MEKEIKKRNLPPEIKSESYEVYRQNFAIITPLGIAKFLGYIMLFLLMMYLIVIYLTNISASDSKFTWYLSWYFDFNGENNIPAYFSTVLLAMAAGILFFIFLIKSRGIKAGENSKKWLFLALIFAFLSIDENVQIHEEVTKLVRPVLAGDFSGLLYWSWVVPYFIAFVILAVYLMPFVLRLPGKTRNLFIIAGFVFVFGAVGLELFEGYFYKKYGLDHLYNKLLYCLEETMEMSGIIIFIYALLDYLAVGHSKIVFLPERTFK